MSNISSCSAKRKGKSDETHSHVRPAKKKSDVECSSSEDAESDSTHLEHLKSICTPKRMDLAVYNPFGETPLIIEACAYGHLAIVRHLVEVRKEDINQRSRIHVRRLILDNSTALHVAVVAYRIDIVRYLTSKSQTNIDATTGSMNSRHVAGGSTALHLAITNLYGEAQTKIVRCLLDHGADWTIKDNAGKQCWELTENYNLTKLLVHYGVGLDSTHNSTSSNIAHKWANSLDQRGACEIIEIATAKGAHIDEPNANGLTPIMIAAIGEQERPNIEAFEQLLNQEVRPIKRLDRINALELVGASLLLIDQSNLGLEYWKKAMQLRFEVKDEPSVPKQIVTLPDVARIAFRDVREVQTKEELENLLKMDPNLLKIQALLVYVRILGLKHDETLYRIYKYGHGRYYTNDRDFLNFTYLILQICDLKKSHLHYIKEMAILSLGIISRPSSTFKDAIQILEDLLVILGETNEDSSSFTDAILSYLVNYSFALMTKPLTTLESDEFKRLLRRAVDMQKRDSRGHDLILLTCSPNIYDWFYPKHGLTVFEKVVSALLECGADPDSKNSNNETATQLLSRSKELNPATRLFCEARSDFST